MTQIAKSCRLCGSVGPHRIIVAREMMFGTQEPFEYYTCSACDTLQLVTIPEPEELIRYYPSNYYSYNASASSGVQQWLITQHDRYKLGIGGRPVGALIERLTIGGADALEMLAQLGIESNARILDVGCGSGALLDRLSRVGFNNLSGADPFIVTDSVTPRGVTLMKKVLSDVDGEFDLIMFNHSLEHVADPLATLKMAHGKLATGGTCLARVPTTSSEARSIYGADWYQIDAPRHIVIPSREGMALAADKAGLRVEKVFDDSNFSQFMVSEAYRRDIAMTDPKIGQIYGVKERREWQMRAEQLNKQGRGDQAGFVLGVK